MIFNNNNFEQTKVIAIMPVLKARKYKIFVVDFMLKFIQI